MRLYRYFARVWADAFLAGSLRVGTLHDFRRIEHGVGRADPQEGRKVVRHHVKDLVIKTEADLNNMDDKDIRALQEFNVFRVDDNVRVENTRFVDGRFSMHFNEPDAFVLCLSRSLSRQTMGQFPGTDTAVEISDPEALVNAVGETLSESGLSATFVALRHVDYANRIQKWNGRDWGDSAVYLKEMRFLPQMEVRACWVPNGAGPICPTILKHLRLANLGRIVPLP